MLALDESQLRALVELVLLVALADESFAPTEHAELLRQVGALAPDFTHAKLGESLEEFVVPEHSTLLWREERIGQINQALRTEAARHAALRAAVKVARADRGVGMREGQFLVLAASLLGANFETMQRFLRESLTPPAEPAEPPTAPRVG